MPKGLTSAKLNWSVLGRATRGVVALGGTPWCDGWHALVRNEIRLKYPDPRETKNGHIGRRVKGVVAFRARSVMENSRSLAASHAPYLLALQVYFYAKGPQIRTAS
jgi:hypothetical protein